MATLAKGTRFVGVRLDTEAFERELAARGLEMWELVKLARVKKSTLSRARHGGRITRDTLMKIADALDKVPEKRMAAALVKGSAAAKKRSSRRRSAA